MVAAIAGKLVSRMGGAETTINVVYSASAEGFVVVADALVPDSSSHEELDREKKRRADCWKKRFHEIFRN